MKVAYYIFALCILVSCTTSLRTSSPEIMGNLPLGVHEVGFRTIFTYDKTRNAVPYSDWSGNLVNDHDPSRGRQFQINIWYPAKAGGGKEITYEHYVDLIGRQTNFTSENENFGKSIFIENTNDLGADGNFTEKEMAQLSRLEVFARVDAKTVDGQFPVVVFPNGGSPAFQSIMCEFLASHGYVVAAFAPKGRFSSGLEVSTIGLETAVDDLEFVLGKLGELSNTDMDKISLLANAISSSVCAAAISRNDNLKALVSLEGGLPSAFEQRLLNKSVFYQAENVKVPMLFIYAPSPSIDPKYTYHLKYADRYYAHFPNMSEFVMLNYGMFDSFIPDIVGEHEGGTKRGFEVANKLVLDFLNSKIKEEKRDLFDAGFLRSSEGIVDTTFVLKATPAAPNIAILKDLFIKNGLDVIDSIYMELKEGGNSQPFSESFFSDYRSWLAWEKDPEYTARQKLYELAFDSYPESTLSNYYLAYYSLQIGQKAKAIRHYRNALSFVADDPDLTRSEKKSITNYANSYLNGIN